MLAFHFVRKIFAEETSESCEFGIRVLLELPGILRGAWSCGRRSRLSGKSAENELLLKVQKEKTSPAYFLGRHRIAEVMNSKTE